MNWRAALGAGALSAAAIMAVPGSARAQGFFDFLFGGSQQQQPAPPPPTNPEVQRPGGIGRVAPAPLGRESVQENAGSTGHGVAFCVRLCDGQHFPMEQMANATPAETCQAICPTSKTKVFFGAEITGAVARDGARDADLNTAFLYRKQLVANCTCNGKDAFGLTTFDVKNDPTLRPGDIVATKDGLMSYGGKSGQPGAFTPVNPVQRRHAIEFRHLEAGRYAARRLRRHPRPTMSRVLSYRQSGQGEHTACWRSTGYASTKHPPTKQTGAGQTDRVGIKKSDKQVIPGLNPVHR